jgi:hypothetical protein
MSIRKIYIILSNFTKVNLSPFFTDMFQWAEILNSEVFQHGLSFEILKPYIWWWIVNLHNQNRTPNLACLVLFKRFCHQSSFLQTFENVIRCILVCSFRWDCCQNDLGRWFDQKGLDTYSNDQVILKKKVQSSTTFNTIKR